MSNWRMCFHYRTKGKPDMSDEQAARYTGVAGLIGVALYVVTVVLIIDFPGINTPAAQLATYAASHQTQLLFEAFVWGAVVVATLSFLVGLWFTLRSGANDVQVTAMLGLVAGVMVYTIVLGGFGPLLTLGYRAHSLAPDTIKLLVDQTLLGTTLSGFPTFVSLGAFSLAILRTRMLPAWAAWLGIVVGVVHIVAAGSLAGDGLFSPSGVPVYVAPLLYYIWMLTISILLLRSPQAATQPSPAGA